MGLFDRMRKRQDVRPAMPAPEKQEQGIKSHGFVLTTGSGSVYSFSKKDDEQFYTMTSNRFGDNNGLGFEVNVTSPTCMVGDTFKFDFTHKETNGEHRGQQVTTSVIKNVNAYSGVPSDRRLPTQPNGNGGYQNENQGFE